jgi:hypothetical protein
LGHGWITIHNKEVEWTKPSDNPHKGLIKCHIIPPKRLKTPVLPVKFDDSQADGLLMSKLIKKKICISKDFISKASW